MKPLIYTIIFSCLSGEINAQTIPVYSVKKEPAKDAKLQPLKTQTNTGVKKLNKITNEASLKIVSAIEMVNVENKFTIGKYEVTQIQWQAVMGNNPSHFKGDNRPVEQISWNDIQEFIQKLNTLTGHSYRLPTEKEWEYASKGGNQSRGYVFSGSNDIKFAGWYFDNSKKVTHIVGQKLPNELGLYDMTGNVWEWCSDWYDNSHQYRVIRGGGWEYYPDASGADNRYFIPPGDRNHAIGFRIASSL